MCCILLRSVSTHAQMCCILERSLSTQAQMDCLYFTNSSVSTRADVLYFTKFSVNTISSEHSFGRCSKCERSLNIHCMISLEGIHRDPTDNKCQVAPTAISASSRFWPSSHPFIFLLLVVYIRMSEARVGAGAAVAAGGRVVDFVCLVVRVT